MVDAKHHAQRVFGSVSAWFVLAVTCLISCGSGCTSTYAALRSEQDIPQLAAMKRATESVPHRTIRVPVRSENGRAISIALHEYGAAEAPRTLVLIHGVLSDCQVWRYVCGALAERHRVILVDLPGSGHSGAPRPHELGPAGYAPDLLARAVLEALDQRLGRHGSGQQITLVGHSLGGMLILRVLADEKLRGEYATLLDRVDGAVLFTPIDVALEKEHPVFRKIAAATDAEVAVASITGLLRHKVAESTFDGVVDPARATREDADRLITILKTRRLRHAHQSMLRQAVPWRQRRPDWQQIETLVAGYERVQPPCLIVWGARDELFPLSMGYKLAAELPQARLRIVPEGLHSLPTEHPETCVRLIQKFLEGVEDSSWFARVDHPVPSD